jgi:tetratricopeptide (TPR) repeat protein
VRTSPYLVPLDFPEVALDLGATPGRRGDEAASRPNARMVPLLAQLHTAQLGGVPHELYEAWCEAARGWVELGAYAAAEAHFEHALRWSQLLGAADPAVAVMCEVAELNAVQADRLEREERGAGRPALRRARAYAQEAARRATEVADPAFEVKVLLRVSDVLDRCGRHEEALALQVRALRLMALAG